MPYDIVKRGARYAIVEKATGKTVGTSDTLEKAEASVRARLAGAHGWKATGKKS